MSLTGRDLVTIADLSDDEVGHILDRAATYANAPKRNTHGALAGTIVATLFFEPSTRTRLSFEAAALRLGANVIGFSDPGATSLKKGETLEDTVRMAAVYADGIIIRHPQEGSAARAAAVSDVPAINAGDGGHEHPTQALLDAFTIEREQGRRSDNHVVLLGDLKHGRTVHSLAVLLTRLGNRVTCAAPPGLEMPPQILDACAKHGHRPDTTSDLHAVVPSADVLYVTRVQQERFDDPAAYQKAAGSYRIDRALLENAKDSITVMHPLPRVDEIPTEIDTHPGAAYFRQAANGVPVRMALLSLILQERST